MFKHLPGAAFDVLFVVGVGLVPLILGRLTPLALNKQPAWQAEGFWGFLVNGQLAFYSLGSLAAMFVLVLRGKVPRHLNLITGMLCFCGLAFLTWLVGIDPKLEHAGTSFVGPITFLLFIITHLLRIVLETAKGMSASDVLRAGDLASQQVMNGLANRKGSSYDA